MAAGIHPAIHHGLGRGVAFGDVFPRRAVGQPEGLNHLEGCAVSRAVVGKVAVVQHVLRFIAGHVGELPVGGEGGQPVLPADLVDQAHHLSLKAGYGAVGLRDGQHLAGIDQVRVADVGVCLDDFAGAYLIFHGQLPHGVSGRHRMGEGGRAGGGCQDGPGQGGSEKQGAEWFHWNQLLYGFPCKVTEIVTIL